ncbi:filamentous hemagglutinin N-terminal domain-containing protein [Nostoc sp. UCD121]|uniref:two-partner secretion domain-containing protein n=1 Tax=unclassified Nostoc TaxID=2593658 RepID=UPI001625E02D|nr:MULTISPECIES: filamentous hemagglutinin N-terminal domain-containing protein [unclassified Nostoc]MBC1221584.1 filamentous hemagglutinin N-terminal domain-containing protein [Nostoc sp. UCD120]MBC1274607.1 filamentous hemagglutinin N-terminal domain-containing protein [Nostoc sp. UCD121]MBC1294846.1 filamentous hemagglutinin N-terminal domain-containing protein [Nostoc sp. UCD122]
MKILRFSIAGWLGWMGAIAVSIHPTFAQLTPDNSLGKERSQVIPFNQNNDIIDGGAARGTNLFHSFQDFNVGVSRGVYFANPEGIINIFSRVTGSNSSNIFGRLGVLGDANLFLLNPNGIVFGKNASLDIQGSFLGTTANSLIFPNGVEFSATNPQVPPLLAINVPVGLQFGSQPGSITNQAVNALNVGSGSTLALLGGEVALDGSFLFTRNGQVKLAAVSGDTTVGLNVNGSSLGFNLPENVGRAPINLTNGSFIVASGNSAIELFGGEIGLNDVFIYGNNGGSIVVDATQLNLDNDSSIVSATFGAARGGDIQVQASDAVNLASSSSIFSDSDDIGAGGDVTINAGKITITGDGTPENIVGISTSSNGKGNGGNLTLNATESVNVNGGFIQVYNNGAGNGGNLTVRTTDAVNITDNGSLGLFSRGSGSTGNIQIETGTLRVQNNFLGGGVTALASNGGSVGSISIQARNAVEVTQSNIYTLIFLPLGSTTQATAGDITIETQRLNLKDGSDIRTNTYSSANAANILIKASEYVRISGKSNVSSNTYTGSGNGGNITIETPQLSLTQGGHINTSSTRSSGNAGNITIRAKDVELDGFVFVPKEQFLAGLDQAAAEEFLSDPLRQEFLSRLGGISDMSDLSSDVTGSNADVRGGTITIDTERLRLSNGGNISTSVLAGRGQGGNLVVHATDSIDITGVGGERLDGSFAPSGLFAEVQTGGIGSGGSIDVTTERLNLSNNGQISASTFNQGNAGNIGINAEQINLRGSSAIITQVDDEAKGNAGNISIQTQLLNIQEESGISSATFGNGNAGNLTVKADNISLIGSNGGLFTGITSSVYEGANGKGGDIDIATNNLDIRDDAQIISGSLGTGDAGNIKINANVLKIIGKLSAIASSTNAGNGGDINLNIADLLLLRDGAFISTTAGRSQAGGDGGNININSKFIVAIPKENSDIKANAYTGSGGKVQINSQGIFGIESRPQPTEKSDITASSELGVSGITNINAPDTNSIQNNFTGASPNVIDTNALIANSCISRSSKQGGTFFITGSGALRNSPGNGLISVYSTGEVRNIEPTSPAWKKGDPIIEAEGLYRLTNGKLLLSRGCR